MNSVMNILDFIEQQYPIRDKVIARLEDPYKRIADADDFPYDKIGPDEFGNITKLVEVEEGRYISVMELISLTKEEVANLKDIALTNVWNVYMSQIDFQDLNITDVMECVRQYQSIVKSRKDSLGVLRL